MPLAYTVTIFLSASLLFLVQPMFAKMVLPLLGGTPTVWNTCMLFFQGVLLAGYGYTHVLTGRFGHRGQMALHFTVLFSAIVALPIAVPHDWSPPTVATPVFWLLWLLVVSVGAPVFAVSTTTPLLQRWFAETDHTSASDPYFLYAASNLGSVLALLGYPLLIEPNFALADQGWLWFGGFAVLTALMATCAWHLKRSRVRVSSSSGSHPVKQNGGRKDFPASADSSINTRRRLYWVALSFVPSSWMLGVTTYITTDLSPMPLLWVIPLALYLLTFIWAFSRVKRGEAKFETGRAKQPASTLSTHALLVRLLPFALLLLASSTIVEGSWQPMLLHLAAFFLAGLVFHGALASDRPSAQFLTEYYLWMAVGGFLGGLLNGLIAPLISSCLLEYPLTLLLAFFLCPQVQPHKLDRLLNVTFVGLTALLIFGWLLDLNIRQSPSLVNLLFLVLLLSLVLIVLNVAHWRKFVGVGVGAVLLMAVLTPLRDGSVLYTGRSYFGVHRVVRSPDESLHYLYHGRTVHGIQDRRPEHHCEPLSYYHRHSPLGEIFEAFSGSGSTQRIAVVGLGTGATICYQQPEEEFTFYEIDPIVQYVAESEELFDHLKRCSRGPYRIIIGDGRLKLAEAPDEYYGMIFFDAFSSDAIPVHLLTREAIAMYLAKMREDGILVFHISNIHVDLEQVLADLAADAGLQCLVCRDRDVAPQDLSRANSVYAVLAHNRADLKELDQTGQWLESRPSTSGRVWTDDYSNIIGILRWW